MANSLQRAAFNRKILYFGTIIGLFTISLYWRGKLEVGKPQRPVDQAPTKFNRFADTLGRDSIGAQATRLELRELDLGDPEIATTAAQLSLVGFRGMVVTGLWRAAIEKQKRHEYHEFELLARMVSRLQPHFVDPWIYQAWNIAYNVSVENDKLGDMYFYIARGIELLAQGDRLNTKMYTAPDGDTRRIGSPDMRYQIGFYYQNKFGVSDKVNTLRSLMQLSITPPDQRDPKRLRKGTEIDPVEFRKFCERNPQLVRRLRVSLGLNRPEDIVQFLDDNYQVPTRWTTGGDLAKDEEQFPILPPSYSDDELTPKWKGEERTWDTIDAYHVARAWFGYGISTIPPPKHDKDGRPIPWTSPKFEDMAPADRFKYRLPRQPAYILYRQMYPRAQTYLAERLSKEGWFDEQSGWNPDERASGGNLWFKQSEADPDVILRTPATAREEWRHAYRMWTKHGAENALVIDRATRANFQTLATRVPGEANSLSGTDFTPDQMRAYGITQENIDAKKALIYYDQNRMMSNFPYFLASSEAEQDALTVAAHRVLFQAEDEKKNAENSAAIRHYVEGLALWREVLVKFPQFHRPERSTQTEEDTYENELDLSNLLREDGDVRKRALQASASIASAVIGFASQAPRGAIVQPFDDVLADTAEDEAQARVAAYDPRVKEAGRKLAREIAKKRANDVHYGQLALASVAAGDSPGQWAAMEAGIERSEQAAAERRVLETPELDWLKRYMAKPFRDANGNYAPTEFDFWLRPSARDTVRSRLGLTRTTEPAASPAPADPAGAQP